MEEKILDIVLEDKRSPLMLSDSSRIDDADYRFNWVENKLKEYGKELTNKQTTGEYVGIGMLSPKDLIPFKQRVIDAIANEDYNCWWEDIIYRTVDENQDVYINDIAGIFWAEVDYIEDYERIKEFIQNKSRV